MATCHQQVATELRGRLPPSPCALPSLHLARSSHRAIAAPLLRSSHLARVPPPFKMYPARSGRRWSAATVIDHAAEAARTQRRGVQEGLSMRAAAQRRREEQLRRKRRVDVRHVRRRTMAGWPPTSVTKSTQLDTSKCATSRCARAPQQKSTRCTRRCAHRSCATRLRRARAPQGDRHVRHMQNFRFSPINGQETAATGH